MNLNGEETVITEYTVENERLLFAFDNIAPHQMNDTIIATVYAEYDGKLYNSAELEYSVAQYCYNTLNKYSADTYAELRTLVVDLLNYGEKSQLYKNYKTDDFVTADLTETQKAWGTSEVREYVNVRDAKYETIENPTVSWKAAGLNLLDSVEMRFKISAESIEGLRVEVESDSGAKWTIESDEFLEEDGSYYIFFDGLNAGQMSEAVNVKIYKGDTLVSNTLRYSIESYAYSYQNSADTNLAELVKAMMKYGDSAYAYVK